MLLLKSSILYEDAPFTYKSDPSIVCESSIKFIISASFQQSAELSTIQIYHYSLQVKQPELASRLLTRPNFLSIKPTTQQSCGLVVLITCNPTLNCRSVRYAIYCVRLLRFSGYCLDRVTLIISTLYVYHKIPGGN